MVEEIQKKKLDPGTDQIQSNPVQHRRGRCKRKETFNENQL